MNKNIGTVDKVIRIIVGLGLLSIVFVGPQTLWGLVGIIPLGTALINWCPLYSLIGMRTNKAE